MPNKLGQIDMTDVAATEPLEEPEVSEPDVTTITLTRASAISLGGGGGSGSRGADRFPRCIVGFVRFHVQNGIGVTRARETLPICPPF